MRFLLEKISCEEIAMIGQECILMKIAEEREKERKES